MKFTKLNAMLVLLLSVVTITNVNAGELEDRGLEIAKEIELRNTGWKSSLEEYRMILRNNHGGKSEREFRTKTLEITGDGDKSLTVFYKPLDVNKTAFLSYSHALEPDDQWIYLPSLKRVKRLSSANKSGPFMGSQIAYEDMASFEVAKFTYKFVSEGKHNGIDCYLIEAYPAYEYSGYSKELVWVDKEHFIVHKVEFYDRKDELLKTLVHSDYKLYMNKYWRSHSRVVTNHQTNKETTLLLNDIKFNLGYASNDFSRSSMKRIF